MVIVRQKLEQGLFLERFFKKRKSKGWSLGMTAVEYALILSLISVIVIGGYRKVGGGYTRIYNRISNALP